MPTKSAHPADRNRAKKNRAARQAAAAQRAGVEAAGDERSTAPQSATAQKSPRNTAEPAEKKKRPSLSMRTTVLPSAGVGVIVLIIAMQEGAPFWVAALVGVLIAGAIIGMLAIKRGLYGN
jgi:cobalamin biosynthesis Mg chelatase CobN